MLAPKRNLDSRLACAHVHAKKKKDRQQSSTIYCCAMVQHVKTQLATAKSTEVSSAELQVDYLILNLELAG